MEQDKEQEITITIDGHLIFMELTVSVSRIKHLKNAWFGRVGKQQKNVPENEIFISLSLEQENNRRPSRFLVVFCVKMLGKCSFRALTKTTEKHTGRQCKLFMSVSTE